VSSHSVPRSERCSCGVALNGRRGQAYNEEAFRYFWALERERCRRSGRPFLLVLVDLEDPQENGRIDPPVASKLFSALRLCLRETDFMGWYREGRVAAAVLTELGDGPTDVCRLVGQRIRAVLRDGLPSDVARRLHVRVHHRGAEPSSGEL
jgi:hypothetical protein